MAELEESDKLVNITEFKNEWHDILTAEDIKGVEGISLHDYMSKNSTIPPEILSELETVCGTETLDCEDEPKDRYVLLSDTAKGTGLISVAYQTKDLEHREKDLAYKYFLSERRQYLPRKTPWEHDRLSKIKRPHIVKNDGPEVIITVEVFRPFQKSRRMVLDQEFQVLGSQKLTELRDKIRCVSDYIIPGDYSDTPNLCPTERAKDLYKSGFFFIEDIFYNDLRDPSNQDNSSVIINWAKKSNVANYSAQRMEDTNFSDLNVRLGQPYLYEHQGSCQHVVVFSDIRWVTRKCQIAPEDPCFYCNSCFQAFHYNSDGNKLFDFKAYRFNLEMK
ncbi:hypothetical protein LSH36_8g14063 [Paralvinella palmiformis]|uniref:snRNA-activating protein complex subunit 3 n=1 Tax=Paralvinella palmiformis TaxID=53620 RepID=A0AAD9NGY6_9ANNE|nr:hypothetical protein LSH36_8g14063 [Paralvinella palmiformis]